MEELGFEGMFCNPKTFFLVLYFLKWFHMCVCCLCTLFCVARRWSPDTDVDCGFFAVALKWEVVASCMIWSFIKIVVHVGTFHDTILGGYATIPGQTDIN